LPPLWAAPELLVELGDEEFEHAAISEATATTPTPSFALTPNRRGIVPSSLKTLV
jgi:hypothetical protein